MIGCDCPVCTSKDPRDMRCRTCVCVEAGDGTRVISDTPPEFRLLAIKAGIKRADAFLITHCHMDHVAGFDDVRRFNTLAGGAVIPCYGLPGALRSLKAVFPYISEEANGQGLFRPMIRFIPATEPFFVGGMRIVPVPVIHPPADTCGWIFEYGGVRAAHIPDCREIPQESLALLKGVDILSLNCLRDRPHPTHLSLEKSVEYAAAIGARRTFFVHMSHSLPHAATEERLPQQIRLAYDGLDVTL